MAPNTILSVLEVEETIDTEEGRENWTMQRRRLGRSSAARGMLMETELWPSDVKVSTGSTSGATPDESVTGDITAATTSKGFRHHHHQ